MVIGSLRMADGVLPQKRRRLMSLSGPHCCARKKPPNRYLNQDIVTKNIKKVLMPIRSDISANWAIV
ncbi:MAG: hypothetical protein HY762_04680 [Planctomycetes bacterium]|nr:hypothetical protein [Planctomycetota bacterium]